MGMQIDEAGSHPAPCRIDQLGALSFDKGVLIHQLIERPGSQVMWLLKLGRFPKTAQDALRDQNTVAGVLTWIYVAGFLLALIAAA